LSKLFEELKRRNVIRVAVAYVIAGWLVLQIAEFVLEIIAAPEWIIKVFLLAIGLGLLPVLIFSWAYEITPEGVKREKDIDRGQSITGGTGRRLNQITIGMLVAVLAFVGLERTFFSRPVPDTPVVASTTSDNSIAVLAFQDLSAEGDQAYFAEGLSEEILNVLAQVDELKVAGRTSSFSFKGKDTDLREIGELLDVAHILEGSVRKSGNRIRVTAQLIQTSDGFHLFSETYDRDLDDVFAVQDEIANNILTSLLSEIVGTELAHKTTPTESAAYEFYLLARERIRSRDFAASNEASMMLDRALEIDPDYAPAYAQKALVTLLLSDQMGSYGVVPIEEARPVAWSLIEKALALDSQLAEAHAVKGLWLDWSAASSDEAEVSLRRALELNPNLSDTGNWLSNVLSRRGDFRDAVRVLEAVTARDPVYAPAFNNLVQNYGRAGSYDKSDALIAKVANIVGENDDVSQAYGTNAVMRGESASAVRHLETALAANRASTIVKLWYGFALLMTADYETLLEIGVPDHRVLAAGGLGEHEMAQEIIAGLTFDVTTGSRQLREIGGYLIGVGRIRQFIDLISEHYGALDNLLETVPVDGDWNTAYLGPLAYAYLQSDDEESYQRLIDEMQRVLAVQGNAGTNNFTRDLSQAQLAALTGNADSALGYLQTSFDSGLRRIPELDSPIFENLRDDPRFTSIRRSMTAHLDAERAKLGMEPYRPIAATD